MFSSNNGKNYSRRSPSSAPSTRSSTSSSSSYHASPTRGISVNSNQGISEYWISSLPQMAFNISLFLAVLRPSSPASATSSPSRHSSYTSSRPKPQITDHSTSSSSAAAAAAHAINNNNNLSITSQSCNPSPVHHRANSGPTIVANLFPESDQMTQSAIVHPGSPHLGMPNSGGNPNTGSQLWKTRLTNIKNSFLGSPRFHRRKMQSKQKLI
jgi:BR serine/threonine kinase